MVFNAVTRVVGLAVSGHLSSAILIFTIQLTDETLNLWERLMYVLPILMIIPVRIAALDCPWDEETETRSDDCDHSQMWGAMLLPERARVCSF